MSKKSKEQFYELAKGAKKVLVLDLGFLGDTVQLIPALNSIRHAMPDAQLDVMVSDHIKYVLELTPWVDNVLGYPRYPKGPSWYQDIGRILKLRWAGYDAIINLNGSDRSCLLTWAIGSKYRLGRIQKILRSFTPFCFTHTTFFPFDGIPVYQQNLNCLEYAGFPRVRAHFNSTIPKEVETRMSSAVDHESGYIHIAPFASHDSKDLKLPVMAEFFNHINANYPEKKLVITCGPSDREVGKLKNLLELLDFEPWKVFSGNTTVLEMAALIERASLHMGADSGPMHVSVMMNTPTFTWFRDYEGSVAWMPSGAHHRSVVGQETDAGLAGIEREELIGSFDKLLHTKAFA